MESRCLRLQGRTDTESELKLQGFCGMLGRNTERKFGKIMKAENLIFQGTISL